MGRLTGDYENKALAVVTTNERSSQLSSRSASPHDSARGAAALGAADPLGTRFEHVLLAPRLATEFLTDRVLLLSPARHSHPHREITLARAAGDPPRALAHLSVFTIGSVAHVKGEADGQPVFGDCDRAGLRTIMDYLTRLGTR